MLERELVEAVVGHRQAEQEREPAGDPVRAADPRRRVAERQPAVHPQRRQDLHHGEQRRRCVASHTFIVIVSRKPSVIVRSVAGECALP